MRPFVTCGFIALTVTSPALPIRAFAAAPQTTPSFVFRGVMQDDKGSVALLELPEQHSVLLVRIGDALPDGRVVIDINMDEITTKDQNGERRIRPPSQILDFAPCPDGPPRPRDVA